MASTSGTSESSDSESRSFIYKPDRGIFIEDSINYEKYVTAFVALAALKNVDDFCLISNPENCAPFDDIILCTKRNSENVIYLFNIRYISNPTKTMDEEFQSVRARFSLPGLYDKFIDVRKKIKNLIPQSYTVACTFKLIFYTNMPIQENSKMFVLSDNNIFTTIEGASYKLKYDFIKCETLAQKRNFLQSINVYAMQGDVDNSSISWIQKYFHSDDNISKIIKINYFKCITNWCKIKTKRAALNSEIIYKLLLFATFKIFSVSLDEYDKSAYKKYEENLSAKVLKSLWKSIVNNNMNVSREGVQYVLGQTLEDLNAMDIDDFEYNKKIISTSDFRPQKPMELQYDVGCLQGKLPFIVENFNLPIKKEWSQYVKVVFICDGQKKIEKLDSLKEHLIVTNSGQHFYVSNIIKEINDIDVNDLFALIFDSGNKNFNKNEVFVNRKINNVLLNETIFSGNHSDLFIVIMNGIDVNKFVKYFKVNAEDVFVKDQSQIELELPVSKKYNLIRQDNFKITPIIGVNVHILKLYENKTKNIIVKWVKTIGNINNIKGNKFSKILDETVNYNDSCYQQLEQSCNYFQNAFTIISGCAGIGKSTLLKEFVQTAPTDNFILLVKLKDHCNYFENYHKDCSAEDHLKQFYKNENKVFKSFFKTKQEKNEIIILFDGFDEITPKYTESIVKIINEIRNRNHKIILTTRSALKNQVEDIFGSFAHSLNEFNEEDRESFLDMYFKKFAPNLLDHTKFINASIQERFFNVPLNLKLLAEIYVHEKKKEVDIENIFQFNLLQLYEKFINCKFEICNTMLKKQFTKLFIIDTPILDKYLKYHSIKLLFSTSAAEYSLIKNSLDQTLEDYIPEAKQNVFLNSENIIIHNTIAEYFVAKWLCIYFSTPLKTMPGEKEFAAFAMKVITMSDCNNEKVNLMFPTARLFFDLMINSNDLDKAAFEGNYKYINEQLDSNISLVYTVNKFNRKLLHTIILKNQLFYNKHTLKVDIDLIKIVKLLFTKSTLTHKDCSNKSAEDYLQLKKSNKSPLIILVHKINDEYFVYFNRHFALWEIFCPENFGNSNVEKLLEILQDNRLFKISDASKNGSLHFAATTGDLELMKRLIEFNDINTKDSSARTPLHSAVENAQMEMVKFLIENKADIIVDDNKSTCVHFAARHGLKDILDYLIEIKIDINIRNKFGATPIHYAVQDKLETVEYLIRNGSDYKSTDNEGFSTLHYATKAGFPDIITYLINELKMNVNAKNHFGATALHFAENLTTVECLFKNGADLNIGDFEGNTFMHYAAKTENLSVIQFLIENQADINATNCFGVTPLHYALITGDISIVKLLISKKAKLTVDNDKSTCLHYSVKSDSVNLIDYLMQSHKFDVNVANIFGHTPLHVAIRHGNMDVIKFLISKGANPILADENKQSCLHISADAGFPQIIQFLFQYFPDVNTTNNLNMTPLHYAVENNSESVELLLSHGANARCVDILGFTCLHYASKSGQVSILSCLISSGNVDLNLRNKIGAAPLHYAAQSNLDAVKVLIDRGADVNIVDCSENTLLHYAAQSGCIDVINYLLQTVNDIDINATNKFGVTPLVMAAENGEINVVKALIKKGASSADKKWAKLFITVNEELLH